MDSPRSLRAYSTHGGTSGYLKLILDAGNYAPNAGGGQRSVMVAVHDKDLTTKNGIMNTRSVKQTSI